MSTSVANDLKDFLAAELKQVESQLNGEKNAAWHSIRKEAYACFEKLGFPGTSHEEWKYTNLGKVLAQAYQSAQPASPAEEWLKKAPFAGMKANVLVLVNGFYSEEHSSILDDASVLGVYSIARLRQEKSERLSQHFTRYAPFADDALNALNAAFLNDGLLLHVPARAVPRYPVLVYHVTDTETAAQLVQSRSIVVLEDHAQLELTELALSLGQYHSFSNYVSELSCGANAHLQYIKLQMEELHAARVDHTSIVQERDSNVRTLCLSLQGGFIRNTLHFKLNGQNTNTYLNGLYLAGQDSLVDNHTLVDHAHPHCYSSELYKGIASANGQAVFNGKVMVRPDAQKTNAYQRNANILLSADAVVNTKPQLEIFADDVKCSHGATTGQMDEEALFYLRSRGISLSSARSLLMHAFAAEVFDWIKNEQVKEELSALVEKRIFSL